VAGILGMILSGCGNDEREADVHAWRAESATATVLTLVVVTGPDDAVVRGQVVSESDTDVVVAATVRVAGGSHGAIGVLREVTVELSEPIGTRQVSNRDGSTVEKQQ